MNYIKHTAKNYVIRCNKKIACLCGVDAAYLNYWTVFVVVLFYSLSSSNDHEPMYGQWVKSESTCSLSEAETSISDPKKVSEYRSREIQL